MPLVEIKAKKLFSNILNKPHQPDRNFQFKKTDFYGVKRSFLHELLQYCETEDKVYCFFCIKSIKEKLIFENSKEKAFTHEGFHLWSKAVSKFRAHQKSKLHCDAYFKIFEASNKKE